MCCSQCTRYHGAAGGLPHTTLTQQVCSRRIKTCSIRDIGCNVQVTYIATSGTHITCTILYNILLYALGDSHGCLGANGTFYTHHRQRSCHTHATMRINRHLATIGLYGTYNGAMGRLNAISISLVGKLKKSTGTRSTRGILGMQASYGRTMVFTRGSIYILYICVRRGARGA